jgi:hypothetical protein
MSTKDSFTYSSHCKKELAVFPSLAGMSLIKLFLGGNNLDFSRPERVWSVTSRLGTGKWLTLFYSAVVSCISCFISVYFTFLLLNFLDFLNDIQAIIGFVNCHCFFFLPARSKNQALYTSSAFGSNLNKIINF